MTGARVVGPALLLLFACGPALAQEPKPTNLDKLIARAIPSYVRVHGAGGFTSVPAYGSGVIVNERGFVLTAWSIALRTDALRVVDHKGRTFPAQVWRANPGLGVALLKLKTEGMAGFSALRLGDSTRLKPGDPLVSLSNPFGFLYGDERPAVMRGVVTAMTRPGRGGFRLVRFPTQLDQVLLHDMPNNPGTQGGPVLTLSGELVGVLGRLVESRATNTILNYAVPAAAISEFVREGVNAREAKSLIPEPPSRRESPPVELGFQLQRAHLVRSPLAFVERVARGSPAAKAGIRPDDMIFRIGERTIRSCRDCDEVLAELVRGQPAQFVVKRGDLMIPLAVDVPQEVR